MAKVGRPSTFKPIYCKRIVDMSLEGKLPHIWAKEIGVSIGTLQTWKGNNEEFRKAWEIAMTNQAAWLQEKFIENPAANYKFVDFGLRRFHHMTDRTEEEKLAARSGNIKLVVDFGGSEDCEDEDDSEE